MAASEAQESKPLKLLNGDILRHKKGGEYTVQQLEVYFTEPFIVDGVAYDAFTPCIEYQGVNSGKKWVRPAFMFTEDRFTIIGNIYNG